MLVENELKKLQKVDAAYFRGKSQCEENGTQNYLVFQPMYRYFKSIAGVGSGNYIYFLKSKSLSDEGLLHLTIKLLQNEVFMVPKQKANSMEAV